MEAEAASFKIEIDSISSGLKVEISVSGIPSTTYNGSLPALIEEDPLTLIVSPAPGFPEFEVTCTPAALPCSASPAFTIGRLAISADVTTDTAPVRSFLRCVPYPTTTTCSNCFAEDACKVISIFERPLKSTVCDSYPREDITKDASGFVTLREKLPEASVAVPVLLPFSCTETPAIGAPSLPIIL